MFPTDDAAPGTMRTRARSLEIVIKRSFQYENALSRKQRRGSYLRHRSIRTIAERLESDFPVHANPGAIHVGTHDPESP